MWIKTICEGNMDKVDYLKGKQFLGVPFARETWIKWPFDGDTILRCIICEGNMDKVFHFMQKQL